MNDEISLDEMQWILSVLAKYVIYSDIRDVAQFLSRKANFCEIEDNQPIKSEEIN